jgi:hypothetical protein
LKQPANYAVNAIGGCRKTDRVGIIIKSFQMKFYLAFFISVLSLAFVITGCKKDKDDPKPNAMTIGDTVINIVGGSLVNYGVGFYHEGYNIDLHLFGEGVAMVETTPGTREVTGEGFHYYSELFSADSTFLTNGTYVFDDTTSISPEISFDYGDYNFNTQEFSTWTEFNEGTIKVRKSGNNYELILNLKDENDEVITGYYNGPLQYFLNGSQAK